jgi:hypothetical protein
MFHTDHHCGTAACWSDQAAFACLRTLPYAAKHDGPSAPPSRWGRFSAPIFGAGFKKISARNGLVFPVQRSWEASLGPIRTRT